MPGLILHRDVPRRALVRALARTMLLLALLPLAAPGVGCGESVSAGPADGSGAAPMIRVLLAHDVPNVPIQSDSSLIAGRTEDRPAVRLALPDRPVQVARTGDGWRIGDADLPGDELTLTPNQDGDLVVGDRAYRGRVRLVPRGGGRFDVVNELDVESYLAGVLPKEIPSTWHAETHAAQAVVARTYALWEMKVTGARRGHFDVYDDTRSQVYGGRLAETPRGREAVARTRGQVVTHATRAGPRIFKAYFHSTSGGATLDVGDVFDEPPTPALSSQYLGDLGSASPRHEWEPVLVRKDELTRRFRRWGQRTGHELAGMARLHEVTVAAANPHGRPTRFVVFDARGTRFDLGPNQLRWAINEDVGDGGQKVQSGWFRPINNADTVVFADGRGWGHGVGMCQWSAQGMASRGDDYRQIVARSYPGTEVVRAY